MMGRPETLSLLALVVAAVFTIAMWRVLRPRPMSRDAVRALWLDAVGALVIVGVVAAGVWLVLTG